jgi:large subunit ribosomal protein L10
VAQIAELRAKLRDADASFRIVKNSLTELAADKAGLQDLKPMLEGPTALALVRGDAAIAAKALSDTARQLRILEFKGGLLNGSALTAEEVQSIARLPARNVLEGQLVGTIAAPLTGLVRTLNALIAGLAIQLQAMADQGLVTGEAPAAVAEPEAEVEPAAEPEPDTTAEPEAPAEPEAAEPEAPAELEAEAAPEPDASEESQAAAEAEPEPEKSKSEPESDIASDADDSDA